MTIPTTAASAAPGAPVAMVPTDGKPASPSAAQAAPPPFQSLLMSQNLDAQFAGASTNALFGRAPEAAGKAAARSDGTGIAHETQRQMLRLQEIA